MTQLIDIRYTVDKNDDIIKREQNITDEFLTECADNRLASTGNPMGEFHQFASIPTIVVEKWLREGFDIYKESAKAIIRRLRTEDLGAFITTTKQI